MDCREFVESVNRDLASTGATCLAARIFWIRARVEERGGENKKKKERKKEEEKRRARSRSHRESGPLSRDARIQAQSIGLRVEEVRTGSSSDRDSTIFDVEFVESVPRAESGEPSRATLGESSGGVRWREIGFVAERAR